MQLNINKDLGKCLPIIQLTINDWPERKKEILKLYDEFELSVDRNIMHNYKPDFCDKDIVKRLTDEHYRILKAELDLSFEALNFKETSIYLAWFERAEKHMYHGLHNHGPMGYSSCLYIEYDEKVHEPLTIVAPYNEPYMGDIIEYTPHDVVEGTLILFPSCLSHYTEPNKSDKARVVMSANYMRLE